ncbi:MAG: hypothetical protein K0R41_2825 [Geminicoccaceae bacterium]|nr:hypothetical protein [Geminicoccaceae bacterium]
MRRNLPRAHLDPGEQEKKEDPEVRGDLKKGARGQTVDQGDGDGRGGEQGDRDAGNDLSHRAGLADALRQLAEQSCHDKQQQQMESMFHCLASRNSLSPSEELAPRQSLPTAADLNESRCQSDNAMFRSGNLEHIPIAWNRGL